MALHVSDGKLVIYIQNEKPGDPDRLRNWLPAPTGEFRFAFRFYGPKGKLIDWTYDMPGVVRAGGHALRAQAVVARRRILLRTCLSLASSEAIARVS